MSLFAELKRRNVIRMAGLYLVGGWIVVQVAETLLPIFGTPAWVLKTLVALLALGFAPALVFSWLYEMTPEGLKRDADVPLGQSIAPLTARRMDRLIGAGLLVVIALVAADRFWPREIKESESSPEPAAANEGAVDTSGMGSDPLIPSIAVLPFVNMSADEDNEYFSDGISEELLNVLVRVEGIGVASRTSSFAYKGREIGAAAIAKELKVGHILEGSVRKAGNQVRITAQLIDAKNDRHLWSETYDRELTDIFAIQDEIANAIVSALRGTLGTAQAKNAVEVRADTENLQAYDLYLKARELFIARTDLQESLRLFEQVVALDPKFARGWEGLAAICSVVESWGIKDRDYSALAISAAERALAIDPTLSMPWAALGMAEHEQMPTNWEKSLEMSDRAVAADDKNATAYLWRGISWVNLGFFDKAVGDMDRCLTIDPAYGNCVRWKALILLHAGHTDQAMALFAQGVAKGFIVNRAASFVVPMLKRGDRVGALLLLKELGVKPAFVTALLAAIENPGVPHPDPRAIVTGSDAPPDQTVGPAMAFLWLGAIEEAASAADNNVDTILAWERHPPQFRNSPAFKRTLEMLGVAKYWRAHGYPPQCHALAGEDFECDEVASL